MHVISRKRLRDFERLHPNAKPGLDSWYKVASKTNWDTFADLRQTYPNADMVGRCIVFNICGNNYRLVVTTRFDLGRMYVREIMTHSEYDRGRWKEECLCRD